MSPRLCEPPAADVRFRSLFSPPCRIVHVNPQRAGLLKHKGVILFPPSAQDPIAITRCVTSPEKQHSPLYQGYSAYSDLTVLKDGSVGILWERGESEGYPFVTFTRVNRSWVDQPAGGAARRE